MIEALSILREEYGFRGYIHAKAIPLSVSYTHLYHDYRSRNEVSKIEAEKFYRYINKVVQDLSLIHIFHWFSGSSAQLKRARDLGCFFSVNAFMLQTKRGREYAKAIPLDRLLIETDLPEETSIDACAELSLIHICKSV